MQFAAWLDVLQPLARGRKPIFGTDCFGFGGRKLTPSIHRIEQEEIAAGGQLRRSEPLRGFFGRAELRGQTEQFLFTFRREGVLERWR